MAARGGVPARRRVAGARGTRPGGCAAAASRAGCCDHGRVTAAGQAAKLLAVSDLHVAHPKNRAIVEELRPDSPVDWLLVAGDVAELCG